MKGKRKISGKSGKKKNDMRIMLVIAGVVLVLILGYFLFSNVETEEFQDNTGDISVEDEDAPDFNVEVGRAYTGCGGYQDDDRRYSCYYGVILATNDPDTCSKFRDSTWKSRCISDFSILRKDLEFCEQVPDTFFREHCYWEIASKTNNPELCAKIVERVDTIDTCYEAAGK